MRPFSVTVRAGALVLAAGLASVSCKKPPSASPSPKPSVSATVAAVNSAVRTGPTPSGRPEVSQQARDEARPQLVAYRKALGEGRSYTKAGKYAAAAKAFSAALEAQPDDARAYAERGYAAFLAKDYNGAERDLERAVAGGGDRRLRAQTFFNLGLVREALNEDSTVAFALSNFLHATSAARKKLEGKSTCPIAVERGPDVPQETRYKDWLAFLADARDSFKNIEGLDLSTNAAVRNAMCVDDTGAGDGPWIALGLGQVFLIRPLAQGIGVTMVASSFRSAFCEPNNDAAVVQTSKDALVVRSHEVRLSEARFCWDDSQPEHECTSAEEEDLDQNPDSTTRWVRACHAEHYTKYEVFDRAKEVWTLRLTQLDDVSSDLDPSEKIQVKVEAQRIVVSGPGCNEVFSLPSGR